MRVHRIRASIPRFRKYSVAAAAPSRGRGAASGMGGRKIRNGSASSHSNCCRGRRSADQRDPRRHGAKMNERPYTPVNGARRNGTPISIPALPSASHAKPKRPVRDLDRDPQRRHRRDAAHQRRIRIPASSANTRHVQRLGQAEEHEDRPASGVPQAAVEREHELNPVADAEPVDHAARPSPCRNRRHGRGSRATANSRGASANGASHEKLNRGKTKISRTAGEQRAAASSACATRRRGVSRRRRQRHRPCRNCAPADR